MSNQSGPTTSPFDHGEWPDYSKTDVWREATCKKNVATVLCHSSQLQRARQLKQNQSTCSDKVCLKTQITVESYESQQESTVNLRH